MIYTTAKFINLVKAGNIGYVGANLVPRQLAKGLQCWPIHEKPNAAARYQMSELYYYDDNEDYYGDYYQENALNDVVSRLENYYYKKGLKKGYQVAARKYRHNKRQRLLRN